MLHSDWHLGPHFRAFVQLKSGLESSRTGGPRPIDEKKLDFQAAFFEARTSGKKLDRAPRRQTELNYGSGRLISVREGPNVRQSFDGIKVMSTIGSWNIDAFAARPDLDRPGFFNNSRIIEPRSGASMRVAPELVVFRSTSTTRAWIEKWQHITGDRARTAAQCRGETLGPVQTKERGWDFDYEGVWQFGAFGPGNIRSWTFASGDTGYSLLNLPIQTTAEREGRHLKRDDPRHNSLGTFNALFPNRQTILGAG